MVALQIIVNIKCDSLLNAFLMIIVLRIFTHARRAAPGMSVSVGRSKLTYLNNYWMGYHEICEILIPRLFM